MRAARFHQTGGLDVLGDENIAAPMPKDGRVLVRLEAVGLNVVLNAVSAARPKVQYTAGGK